MKAAHKTDSAKSRDAIGVVCMYLLLGTGSSLLFNSWKVSDSSLRDRVRIRRNQMDFAL